MERKLACTCDECTAVAREAPAGKAGWVWISGKAVGAMERGRDLPVGYSILTDTKDPAATAYSARRPVDRSENNSLIGVSAVTPPKLRAFRRSL
jgi:hypothetical protein